jgi:tetratricopeptide (TPR) repeat protein
MKRTITLIASAILLTLTLKLALAMALPGRTDYQDAMTAANNLYLAAEYGAAARIYEQILAQGHEADSALHYNLGNAYFQQGDVSRALLSYERAAALSPRDSDIRANLEAARGLAGGLPTGTSVPSAAPGLISELYAGSHWLSLNESGLLALALWLAAGFLFLASRLLRTRRLQLLARSALVAAMLLFLLSAVALGGRLYLDSHMPQSPGVQAGMAIEGSLQLP